jgi:phage terminase small subunit
MARKSAPKRLLTDKQRAFVVAYCHNGFNGVRAARSAGYQGSYSTLAVSAHDNLKNPKVREEIDKHFKRIAMGEDEVIARLTSIAQSDISDVLNPDGSFDIKTVRRRGKGHLIKEQTIVEKRIPREDGEDILVRTTKLKLHDAKDALKTLARYHGLLVDHVDHTSNGKELTALTADILAAADKRAEKEVAQFEEDRFGSDTADD